MGCAADWMPDCDHAQMTKDAATGDYEFKATLNKGWAENYGDGGAPNGNNIPLHVAATRPVTFTYDHATHVVSVMRRPAPGRPVRPARRTRRPRCRPPPDPPGAPAATAGPRRGG